MGTDYIRQKVLRHYGIPGQKWGVKHGPPYPLNQALHNRLVAQRKESEKEIRIGSIDNSHSRQKSSDKGVLPGVALLFDVVTFNPVGAGQDIVALRASMNARKLERKRDKEETDPESGLKLKRKPLTDKLDAVRTNPEYHNWSNDTKNNCVLCSATMELRQRGYDVFAKKADYGYTDDVFKKFFKGAEPVRIKGSVDTLEDFVARRHDKNIQETRRKLADDTKEAMLSQGNGARGALSITWRGMLSGHSLYYKVENDNVTLIDAQCGKIYNDKSTDKLLRNKIDGATVTRLDNTKPDFKELKEEACY